MKSLNQKNKILIIQTAFIGDVILATSFIRQVKDNFPDSELHFLLRKGNQKITENSPFISKTIIWNKSEKWKSLLSCLKEVRKEKYDIVFNIQRFFNSGLLTALSGAKIKIGFDKNPMSLFFTHKISHMIPHSTDGSYLHEVERNQQLISPIKKQSLTRARPELYFTESEKDKVETIKQETNTDNKPYIVMAPSSVWFTKQLQKKKWVELVRNLIDYQIYCIGGPDDKEYIDSIIANQHHATNLCGELSLTESAYLMQDAHRVMVNDSAPLHLASSVNANTIAFFCSTVEEFGYGPLAENHQIISKKLECKPCGLHGKKECPLGHFNCSEFVDLNTVMKNI